MDTWTIVGFSALVVAIYLSGVISGRAYRHLTIEEKGRMVDTFSNFQARLLVPVMLLVIARVIIGYADRIVPPGMFAESNVPTAALYTLLAFFTYWIINSVLVFRKLKKTFPNRKFIWRQRVAHTVVVVGVLVYIGMVFESVAIPYRLKAYKSMYDVRGNE